MIIKLSKAYYDILKELDFSELGENIAFDDINNSVDIHDRRMFFIVFSEIITDKGMTKDFADVNEYGRILYAIYDTIQFEMEKSGS